MTIDKAIEIQTLYTTPPIHPCIEGDPELVDAIKLGVESLKREQECRIEQQMIKGIQKPTQIWLLPGETID